jgi:hypothetical protein
MAFVNLTPHAINVVNGPTFPPSGNLARVKSHLGPAEDIDGVPVSVQGFGEVEGLPEPQPNTIFIVSGLVKSRCQDRADVVVPGDQVRNEAGQVVGCKCLVR